MKVTPRAFLISIVVTLSGCAHHDVLRSDSDVPSMPPRIQKHGFSVARPPNDSWFIQSTGQADDHVFFRKKISDPDRSIFLTVGVAETSSEVRSVQDVIRIESDQLTSTSRNSLVKKSVVASTTRPGLCADFSALALDNQWHDSSGKPFPMSLIGFLCAHPSSPNRVLIAFYSERAPGATFSGELPADAQEILRSIQIEAAPAPSEPRP